MIHFYLFLDFYPAHTFDTKAYAKNSINSEKYMPVNVKHAISSSQSKCPLSKVNVYFPILPLNYEMEKLITPSTNKGKIVI